MAPDGGDFQTPIERRIVYEIGPFKVVSERHLSGVGQVEWEYLLLEGHDWVIVLPETDSGRWLMVTQSRVGSRRASWEFPAGLMEPGEEPAAAALRELREETGYEPGQLVALGTLWPNPAIQRIRCHVFWARGCRLACEQSLDPSEQVEVSLHDMEEIRAAVRDGRIDHAVVLAALTKYELTREGGAG